MRATTTSGYRAITGKGANSFAVELEPTTDTVHLAKTIDPSQPRDAMIVQMTPPRIGPGPLRPHPNNPRYFTDDTGRPIYLTGSHTWANFATDQGEAGLDYERYLGLLDAHGHNFFRGWVWDVPTSDQGFNGGPFDHVPHPWHRTGTDRATDGKPRFDLSRWNDAFFERIRARTIRAGERGKYVAIMLFQGFAWEFNRRPDDGFPYDGRNNVNGVDGGPGYGASTMEHPDVLAVQEAYVRRVIDVVNDLDNVLYEIANEAGPYSTLWQYHLIDHVHSYERTLPHQHPVGMTFQFEGGQNAVLYASRADWISPDCDPANRAEPPVADGSKVVVFDTDHGYDWRTLRVDGRAGWVDWAWKVFCRGNHTLFMDPYLARITADGEVRNAPLGVHSDEPYFGLEPDPFWDPMRALLGRTAAVAARVDLAVAVPRPDLASTGYCLAAPGRQYLVYVPAHKGRCTVDVAPSEHPGGYAATWLAADGPVERGGGPVIETGVQSFESPYTGGTLLLLTAGATGPMGRESHQPRPRR